MSIVGIDFGHDSCVVAVAKGGRIKCVDNEQGLRTTPSIVAFGKRQRFFGVEAKNQAVTDPQNSIYGIKRYVGRAYTDLWTKADTASFKTVMMTDSGVGFQTSYLGQDKIFTTEQLVGMMFTHLKGLAEDKILDEVQECVISVPSYFTDPERKAVLDAAHIGGLLPVKLMNDTTAAALNYGMLKKDLPELNAPPRNVVIVDCGASAFQVCVGAFNKRNMTILASETDMNVGGRHFDEAIAKYIKNKFHFKENVDLADISVLRKVLTAAEKIKLQMSTTTSELTPEIDYLERNVGNTICRATFEKICSVRLGRVETVLKKCLQNSKLDVDDIHSVEILGGSSCIPAIKRLIEKVFRKRPRSTMKSDEAVALGCAYQCSLLAGADNIVGNFSVTDITPYQIKLMWDGPLQGKREQVMFPIHCKLPSNCSIRLAVLANSTGRKCFQVAYEEIESNPSMIIGKVVIDLKDVVSKSPVINIMASVNGNGLCRIYRVTLEEKVDNGESRNPDAMDTSESIQQDQYITLQDVMVENHVFGMQRSELEEKIREEIQMVKADNLEKIRQSTRATLEQRLNALQIRLENVLNRFVDKSERESLHVYLTGVKAWLAGEGLEEPTVVYRKKFDELKEKTQVIKDRETLHDMELKIRSARNEMALCNVGPGCNYIDHDKIEQMMTFLNECEKWVAQCRTKYPSTFQPQVSLRIENRRALLEKRIRPIFNTRLPNYFLKQISEQ